MKTCGGYGEAWGELWEAMGKASGKQKPRTDEVAERPLLCGLGGAARPSGLCGRVARSNE